MPAKTAASAGNPFPKGAYPGYAGDLLVETDFLTKNVNSFLTF